MRGGGVEISCSADGGAGDAASRKATSRDGVPRPATTKAAGDSAGWAQQAQAACDPGPRRLAPMSIDCAAAAPAMRPLKPEAITVEQ